MTNDQMDIMFFQYLKIERQYSKNTISSYELDLKIFNEMMQKNYVDLTLDDAKYYLSFLRDNYKNNTVLRKMSSVKSLYKFLEGEKTK